MRLVASLNRVATTKLFGRRYSNGELIYDYGKAWVVMDRTVDDDERIKQRSGFFSVKGDSGSAVFSQNGEFVGLLHGTYPERNMSYVTAVQDLVEDIKRIAGAVEVTMLCT